MHSTHDLASAITNWTVAPSAEGELLARARAALIDSVGVAVAARYDEGYIVAAEGVRDECPAGPSTVLVTGERTSPGMAAFLNGFAVHALDYDDVSDTIYGHPSAVIFPAVLAVAEELKAPLEDILHAYVVGFEVACAVAKDIPVRPHYSRGWHATSTVGVIGAAAALSRLLHFDAEETTHLLGAAATTASGSRQNFGTMSKPFHAGHAARDAVLAAKLVEKGFTADAQALEGPLGYFALFSQGSGQNNASRIPSGDMESDLLNVGLNVKRYPCCYNTHRTAGAALALSGKWNPEEIEQITVTVEPQGLDPLIHHRPTTGIEAKFSLEYVVAAALLDGTLGLSSFTDDRVAREDVQALLRRVDIGESPTPPTGVPEWDYAFSVIAVTVGGDTHHARVDIPDGHRSRPLSGAELDEKYLDCFSYAGRSDGPETLEYLRDPDLTRPFVLSMNGTNESQTLAASF